MEANSNMELVQANSNHIDEKKSSKAPSRHSLVENTSKDVEELKQFLNDVDQG